MKFKTKTIFSILLIYLFFTTGIYSEFILQELITGFNYNNWYKAKTGFTPDSAWFGAWVITASKGDIYFGFGTARPAESDGAILARINGNSLDSLGLLDEQGIHEMQSLRDTLYLIGSDPSMGDGWDAGNFYKFIPPNNFSKLRYNPQKKPLLPNVLHIWGLFVDSLNETIYCSTGSYDPKQYSKNGGQCGNPNDSTIACFGELWQTLDKGNSWELISGRKPYDFSRFRAYDIIRFNNVLFANVSDVNSNSLKMSVDTGKTWTLVPKVVPSSLARMKIFNNKLLVVDNSYSRIHTIDKDGNIETKILPGYFNYSFNVFAIAENNYLFTYFADGSVYGTTDLEKWFKIISPNSKNYLSIAYNDYDKSLILSERGKNANLYKIDISTLLNTEVANSSEKNNEIDISIHDNNISLKNYVNIVNVNIEVINVYGQVIENYFLNNFNNKNLPVNLSILSNGVYFLILQSDRLTKTFKFIKSE